MMIKGRTCANCSTDIAICPYRFTEKKRSEVTDGHTCDCWAANQNPEISQEKIDWLKEIGAKRFETPMNWYLRSNQLFSDKFIAETPLEVLKANYESGRFD
jgi:coenzyme F420-reducing hydrogenase beta subunit